MDWHVAWMWLMGSVIAIALALFAWGLITSAGRARRSPPPDTLPPPSHTPPPSPPPPPYTPPRSHHPHQCPPSLRPPLHYSLRR